MAWPLVPEDGQFKYANMKLFEHCSNWSPDYPLFSGEQNMTTWLKELTIKSFILSSNELPKLPRAGLTGTIGQGSWWPLIKTQGTSGFVNILNWNWFDLSNTPQYHRTKLKAKGKHHLSNKFIPRRFSPASPREECVTERIGYVIPSRSSVETPSDEAGWRGLTSSFSTRNWGLRCSLGGLS